VFNKIDLMGAEGPRIVTGSDGIPPKPGSRRRAGRTQRVARSRCAGRAPNQVRRTLHLDMLAAALRSDLYRREAVRAERQCDDGSGSSTSSSIFGNGQNLGSRGVVLLAPPESARKQRVAS